MKYIFIITLFIISLSTINANILSFFTGGLFSPPPMEHSQALEVIQRSSCWHLPIVKSLIERFCLAPTLTDEGRYRLAIALANCHLSTSNLEQIPCTIDEQVELCTRRIPNIDHAYQTYTTFFAHIDSLCFYMKKDNFHQSTEDAINALALATLRSKETFIEFSRDMLTNQEELNDNFNKHAAIEDERFKHLVENLSTAKTILQYISIGQERLSNQSDQLVSQTAEINAQQYQTLKQLGLVSLQLTEYEKQEKERFEITLGRMLLFEDQIKLQSQTFNQSYTTLTTQVLSTHQHLNSLSTQLVHDLELTRGQLSSLIQDVFYAIQHLHIELISFTSLLFYPVMFIIIFLFTSTARAYNARMYLYILIGIVFLFERSLAKNTTIALYISHFIMCTMRYLHATLLSLSITILSYIFGHSTSIPTSTIIIDHLQQSTSTTNTILKSPYDIVLSCPSCQITQHTILSWLIHHFTFAESNPNLIQLYESLTTNLPSILLTSDEYIAMIEVTRILYLFISTFIWLYTIYSYVDPFHYIENRMDDFSTRMSLLDASLYSFKQKMVLLSQMIKDKSASSFDSFSKRLTPIFSSNQDVIINTNDIDNNEQDPEGPYITKALVSTNNNNKNSNNNNNNNPSPTSSSSLLSTPTTRRIGSRKPISKQPVITPELTKPLNNRPSNRLSSQTEEELQQLDTVLDEDGEIIYIPSPDKVSKNNKNNITKTKTTKPIMTSSSSSSFNNDNGPESIPTTNKRGARGRKSTVEPEPIITKDENNDYDDNHITANRRAGRRGNSTRRAK